MYRILSAGRRLAVLVLALGAASLAEAAMSIASVTPTPTLTPTPSSTPTPTCFLIPGNFSFGSVTVAPLHPFDGFVAKAGLHRYEATGVGKKELRIKRLLG